MKHFFEVHFHPKTVSSTDNFIPKQFHPKAVSSQSGFIPKPFHLKTVPFQSPYSSDPSIPADPPFPGRPYPSPGPFSPGPSIPWTPFSLNCGQDSRPQFHEKTSREKKKAKMERERGKTREMLGAPPFVPPPFGDTTFSGSGLPLPFGAPTIIFWTNMWLDATVIG